MVTGHGGKPLRARAPPARRPARGWGLGLGSLKPAKKQMYLQ